MFATEKRTLPFHIPQIDDAEVNAVTAVLRSGWLTTGPKVREFEQKFAEHVGAKHAVALNSCTAALHVALEACGITDGDEVIVPTLTFAATAEAVLYLRARPVLVDCEPEHFNLDPRAAETAITQKTKAIVPVHFAGHPCEMESILQLKTNYQLRIIEDAAHALPARSRVGVVGTTGDITCFSFYSTKSVTTGEGGMAVTDEDGLADRMRIMSLHGISKDAWKRYTAAGSWRYEILEAGFKYNMTDIQAALGLVQLAKCGRMRERRAEIAARYQRAFEDSDALHTVDRDELVCHGWHLFVILLNLDVLSITRDQLIEYLRESGVGTSVHFIPLHLHPLYQQRFGYKHGQFPVAESYFSRCISLPLYSSMSDDDVDYVIDNVLRVVTLFRR